MAVSIEQAAANVFATWLAAKLPDVRVESRWVANDKNFPGPNGKAISIIPAGPRQDIPLDLRILKKTNVGSTQVEAVWQVAACYQPYQLDVWATYPAVRDDIKARLDQCLHAGASNLPWAWNPDPVGHGVLLPILDGFETVDSVADFYFEEPDLDDSADAMGHSIFRAHFRGGGHFMLPVTTTTARQKLVKFQLYLNGETTPQTTSIP